VHISKLAPSAGEFKVFLYLFPGLVLKRYPGDAPLQSCVVSRR